MLETQRGARHSDFPFRVVFGSKCEFKCVYTVLNKFSVAHSVSHSNWAWNGCMHTRLKYLENWILYFWGAIFKPNIWYFHNIITKLFPSSLHLQQIQMPNLVTPVFWLQIKFYGFYPQIESVSSQIPFADTPKTHPVTQSTLGYLQNKSRRLNGFLTKIYHIFYLSREHFA